MVVEVAPKAAEATGVDGEDKGTAQYADHGIRIGTSCATSPAPIDFGPGVEFGRKPKLTAHHPREAIKLQLRPGRKTAGERLHLIVRTDNVHAPTISKLRT